MQPLDLLCESGIIRAEIVECLCDPRAAVRVTIKPEKAKFLFQLFELLQTRLPGVLRQ